MTDTDRQVRACGKCSASDTHAHHIQYVAFNHPVTGEPVDLSVSKHVQCCAADGCDICSTDVEHAGLSQVPTHPSDEFTAYMQAKSSDHHQALFERHGIESPNHVRPADQEG